MTHCFAVGGSDFIASTDGGQSWAIQSQSGSSLYTVACESDSACVSSGFNGSPSGPQSFFYTADGGSTWTTGSAPYGTIGTYMTCQPPSCISVGSGLLQTVDGGAAWTLAGSNASTTTFNSVDCLPTTSTCLAVGTNTGGVSTPTLPGELIISTDGGALDQLISPAGQYRQHQSGGLWLRDHLLGDGLLSDRGQPLVTAMTTDGGNSWTSVTGPAGFAYTSSSFGAIAMACTSATTCVIVGTGASGPISFISSNSGGTLGPKHHRVVRSSAVLRSSPTDQAGSRRRAGG